MLLLQRKVEYVGHMIKPSEREIDSTNTNSLLNDKPPATKMQLQSFLGLCNVYPRFIRDFAEFAQPLNVLLRKGTTEKFELNDEHL